jgi:ribosomal protein S27AE
VEARVCPNCGSAKIEDFHLQIETAEKRVQCLQCGWRGKDGELLTLDASQAAQGGITTDAAMIISEKVAEDFLRFLAKDAGQQVGLAMVNSGLVGLKDAKKLARLIRAACLGAHKGVLDEINQIQEELRSGAGN